MEEEDKLCSTARRYLAMRHNRTAVAVCAWRSAAGRSLMGRSCRGHRVPANRERRGDGRRLQAAAAVPMSEIGWPRYWAAQATKAAANRRHSPGSLVKALAILASLTGEESIFRGAAERFLTLVNAEFARDPVVGAPALAHD